MRNLILMVLILLISCSVPAAEAPKLGALGDAYFGRDVPALQRDVARHLYYAALGDWLLSMSAGGDSARSVEAAKRADASVLQAIAIDPAFPHAYVLRSRITYSLMTQGAIERAEAAKRFQESHETAKKLAPEDPLVVLLESIDQYYRPNGDRPRGLALMRQSIDGLAARAGDDPHAAIWLPIVWSWYGMTYLGEGDIELARAAFESALKVRPDYAYVRTAFMPMTELVDGGKLPRFPSTGWKALVSDPEGDGRMPALADLRDVAWRADGDAVWFRLALAADGDPERFGVNLALDLDDDQKTGNGWWAGNTAFKYDRLVTVWVRRGGDGRYRGAVGTADAPDVAGGAMVTSAPGTVRFAMEPSKRAILVGIPRSVLGGRSVQVVATVGSNTTWNDVAPATGSAMLDVAQP